MAGADRTPAVALSALMMVAVMAAVRMPDGLNAVADRGADDHARRRPESLRPER